MEKEIWKSLKGLVECGDNYSVSNLGRVKNNNTGRILKGRNVTGNGYMNVLLQLNGNSKQYLVHRLVAIAFLPNPNNYKFINHKNKNRSDNHLENIEWCNSSMNNKGTKGKRSTVHSYEPFEDEVFVPITAIKQLNGYGENLEISNYGRTRNIKTGLITESKNKNKYRQKNLKKNSEIRSVAIHRIVALGYIEIPERLKNVPFEKLQVDHIDGNTHNNHVSNLRWVTASENQTFAKQMQKQQKYPIIGQLQGQLEFDFGF